MHHNTHVEHRKELSTINQNSEIGVKNFNRNWSEFLPLLFDQLDEFKASDGNCGDKHPNVISLPKNELVGC
jgi:hypothetical protein